MEEPTRLELVNSRFAIYGLTNLAIAPNTVVPEAGLEPARSQ